MGNIFENLAFLIILFLCIKDYTVYFIVRFYISSIKCRIFISILYITFLLFISNYRIRLLIFFGCHCSHKEYFLIFHTDSTPHLAAGIYM